MKNINLISVKKFIYIYNLSKHTYLISNIAGSSFTGNDYSLHEHILIHGNDIIFVIIVFLNA